MFIIHSRVNCRGETLKSPSIKPARWENGKMWKVSRSSRLSRVFLLQWLYELLPTRVSEMNRPALALFPWKLNWLRELMMTECFLSERVKSSLRLSILVTLQSSHSLRSRLCCCNIFYGHLRWVFPSPKVVGAFYGAQLYSTPHMKLPHCWFRAASRAWCS